MYSTNNYIKVTNAAKEKQEILEQSGYLHSNYNRFKDISNYKSIFYQSKLQTLGNRIISKQIAREKQIYNELGVNGVEELTQRFFTDEGLQNFIDSNFNNIYNQVAEALKNNSDDSNYMNKKITKKGKSQIEDYIQSSFDKELEKMSNEYNNNLAKILNKGTLSQNIVEPLKKISNRKENRQFKTGYEYSKSALSQWKGNLLEQTLGMFISQLSKVKNVKITGSDLDELNKFIKSDVTAFTDNLSIGFSAKNYKLTVDKKSGEVKLNRSLTLHNGGSFDSFLQRIDSLKSKDLDNYLKQISSSFKSDNYYYNLINEAIKKDSFSSSQPAEDFMNTIKSLAAAWFGTQLITNTGEGLAGQNVDFLIISNKGFIPISTLLVALREQSASLNVNIKSTTNLNEEEIYMKKINSPYTAGFYGQQVRNIGYYAGQEVYRGITVSEIKINFLLKQFM